MIGAVDLSGKERQLAVPLRPENSYSVAMGGLPSSANRRTFILHNSEKTEQHE
jgi:hypothetical protein